ncbi:hypothetical protein EI555_011995 [Monodon monoceros]|uniref:Proteasomal ATPase OB C-terminal domain-containing protein n=1 Tax=Monodon monoceros TaxID=40151 RepID=A0A4U1FDK1_MONMO|nr:hypothetical protein EI555_011995 [Monodon monoceros]
MPGPSPGGRGAGPRGAVDGAGGGGGRERSPERWEKTFRMNLEKLSKPELLTLFSILEGELEARDLVIEALKQRLKWPKQDVSKSGGHGPGGGKKDDKDKKKNYESPIPARVGQKKKRIKGPDAASILPLVTSHTQYWLMLKLERTEDCLLMEEEFIRNLEQMRPLEEKQEEERSKVGDLRGTPMSVGIFEEIIDDSHAIVSTFVGSEHYVSILSFVDKDLLEPGCSVLLSHRCML